MGQQTTFLEQVEQHARTALKHIVLPEGQDDRIQQAVKIITDRKTARLTVLGPDNEIAAALHHLGAGPGAVQIIDPQRSEKSQVYTEKFYELRKHKGITFQQACQIVEDPLYFGAMMVKCGDADGMVAGANHSTPDTIRPALQIIKALPGVRTISGAFFICRDTRTYLFADCGVVENPDVQQLAEIAVATASTALQFGIQPRVAMLAYSTKSHSPSPDAKKVVDATVLAKAEIVRRFGDQVIIDGELQFDAAFAPEVARRKCPDSPVGGRANVLIFPNLLAGNIVYKAVQRFSGADAYGPILQGMAKPVSDLSRGCNAEDVAATVAITAVQAQQQASGE
jgi:phosphate acetyltransferase